MTKQKNKTADKNTCNADDKYKRIKICYRCLQKFDNKTNLKDGDNCLNKGCAGPILLLEENLESIFLKLRKKNYRPIWLSTGEFCSHGFILRLYPFQCFKHLPPLPKGFKSSPDHSAFLMERKYKNTDPVKRRIEVEEAIKDVENWVATLPLIYTLKTTLVFTSKAVAEKLNIQFLNSDNFYDSRVIDLAPDKYSVEFYRTVKEEETENEVANIFPLYRNNKAKLISFKLIF